MIRISIEIEERMGEDETTVNVDASARHLQPLTARELDMQVAIVAAIITGARQHQAASGADEYRERIETKGGAR